MLERFHGTRLANRLFVAALCVAAAQALLNRAPVQVPVKAAAASDNQAATDPAPSLVCVYATSMSFEQQTQMDCPQYPPNPNVPPVIRSAGEVLMPHNIR